jgi:hypothetical protein
VVPFPGPVPSKNKPQKISKLLIPHVAFLFNACSFFNSHSGRWSQNWVHSARRPFTGLLYLPRVIVWMENLVEWRLAGETEVLGENLPQRQFVHHKSYLTRTWLEPGPNACSYLCTWLTFTCIFELYKKFN